MLVFNELRLTSDNKCLIIDVSVEDISYFKNVTIESILIDTQETWVPEGPSSKAVTVYDSTKENNILDVLQDNTGRHVRLEVKKPFINTSVKQMYFVYVISDISNAPEAALAPCTCSTDRIMGTVVNTYYLYKTLLASIKEIAIDCSNNQNFIQDFLRLQAIDANIRTGNYPLAIKYWNMFFNKEIKEINYKPCGCHGKY